MARTAWVEGLANKVIVAPPWRPDPEPPIFELNLVSIEETRPLEAFITMFVRARRAITR
jgi:hypothetical protein